MTDDIEINEIDPTAIKGLTLAITATLEQVSRKEAQEIVERARQSNQCMFSNNK